MIASRLLARRSVATAGNPRIVRAAAQQPNVGDSRAATTAATTTTGPVVRWFSAGQTTHQHRSSAIGKNSEYDNKYNRNSRNFSLRSLTTTDESKASADVASLCPKQIQVRLNEFQDLFVEARMCIDDVKDSFGTVYYDDDADDAREAVETAVNFFEALLAEITDTDEKNRVLRGNGLKVEQLKGELELTLAGGHDH